MNYTCAGFTVHFIDGGRLLLRVVPNTEEITSTHASQIVFSNTYIRIDWSNGSNSIYYPS